MKIPTVKGVVLKKKYASDARQVAITCPYCGKRHVHGWPYDSEATTHRIAHCDYSDPDNPIKANDGYFITVG